MKNKSFYPLIIFMIILVALLVLAFYFKDYMPEIIKHEEEQKNEKTLGDCLKEKNISLYVLRENSINEEQIKEIGSLVDYISIIDCSKNKERCASIIITPAWLIDGHIYYNIFSRGALIKIGECDGLQDKH